ncbi:MAG: YbhB/YbcL family Raf kinase inhibitor-like protein [Gemmatimonadetes bacterium]|nr:YbhB/YbcL family Raf kinase inhibitor-like protein [Gemmatimonadota bacterium]
MESMRVTTTAWPDGGEIPLLYTQVGGETSPAVQWSNVPPGTASFVLIFHDLDAPVGDGLDDTLHWLLWNIPGTSTGIPRGLPDTFKLEDGTRQISASGSRYRGPGAAGAGPHHHYVLEVYALDTLLDVEVVPQVPRGPNPAVETRKAVFAAMAGHVLGKGTHSGLFRRPR